MLKHVTESGRDIEMLSDVGSGLNENRGNFLKRLDRVVAREVSTVIVAYKDRLTRFGLNTLYALASVYETELVVLKPAEKSSPYEELTRDLITMIAHFSGKLRGLRSHKNKETLPEPKPTHKQDSNLYTSLLIAENSIERMMSSYWIDMS